MDHIKASQTSTGNATGEGTQGVYNFLNLTSTSFPSGVTFISNSKNTSSNHAMISGGSLVRKDVPPFVKAGREPLSFVGINSIGLRRRSFSDEEIGEIQEIYRVLYQKKYNNTQAINKIEIDFKVSKNRDEIIDFVKNSGRGIMRGYNQK